MIWMARSRLRGPSSSAAMMAWNWPSTSLPLLTEKDRAWPRSVACRCECALWRSQSEWSGSLWRQSSRGLTTFSSIAFTSCRSAACHSLTKRASVVWSEESSTIPSFMSWRLRTSATLSVRLYSSHRLSVTSRRVSVTTRTVSSPPPLSEASTAFEAFMKALGKALWVSEGRRRNAGPRREQPARPPREIASVVVPPALARARAFAAGVERMAAAAGGRRIRVLDREAAAHQVFLVVALRAFQVAQAHRIDDHPHPGDLDDLVPVGGLVQNHPVREARAAAALDVDPQAALRDVRLFLLQDPLDLLRRRSGEVDHQPSPPLDNDRTGNPRRSEARANRVSNTIIAASAEAT